MSDEALIASLVAARLAGSTVDTVPPLDLERGYAIARRVWPLLGPGAGWKIGATNRGGQAFLGVAEPIYGRMTAGSLFADPDAIALPGSGDCEAEPEFLFHLAGDVAPGSDPLAAVDRVALGLEIVRPSRSDAFDLGVGFIVADNAAHVGIVVGPNIDAAALDTPETVGVRLLHNDIEVGKGDAAAVLGNPRDALRWLATQVPLRAGEWIASGAILKACRFAIGDTVVADFGTFGRVSARRA